MENDSEERILIRRYLLGETTEAETEDVERRMMTDDAFFNMVISQEEEFIEEYAQGHMADEVRARFERSYLLSTEGREQVRITKELLDYAATFQRPRPVVTTGVRKAGVWLAALHSPYLRIAAVILISAALIFATYRAYFARTDVERGLAALRQVYKSSRPTEARLSELDYAPWSPTRSGNNEQGPGAENSAFAERILLDAVHSNPGADSYHALGIFYMTNRLFDKSIAQFEVSANYATPNATLHSDWGAALLERGQANSGQKESRTLEDYSQSLEHLEKALEMEPSRLDASFNLALLYEAQGMSERAKEAWGEYLRKDSVSKWAEEARERLRQLNERQRTSLPRQEEPLEQFIKAYTSSEPEHAWQMLSRNTESLSGNIIFEKLLDSYLDETLNGAKAERRLALDVLIFAGELESQRANDQYYQTVAEFYKERSLDDLQLLKEAHKLIKQGNKKYFEDQYDQAIKLYTRAGEVFRGLGDMAEASRTDYLVVYCHTDVASAKTGLSLLTELTHYCLSNQFRWLFTRCSISLAANYYVEGEYSEAAKHYQSALVAAEGIEDPLSVLDCLDSLIELYRSIENYTRSFEYIQRSFTLTSAITLSPVQRLRHYSIIASALGSASLWTAALEYQKESLSGDVSAALVNATIAYTHLGALYAKQKKYDDALRSIELAYDTANRISTERVKDRLIAYSSLYLGDIYRDNQEYGMAISTYTNSIETFSNLDIPVILYQAHKGRLYCYLANGDGRLIQEELDTLLKILERDRSSILEADNRNNFFDKEQSVYDIAIEYTLFKLSDERKAFEYSEASRARSLLDKINKPGTKISSPLKLSEVENQLPDTAQIVQYSVLDQRSIAWVISKEDFLSTSIEVGQEKLDADLRDYLRLISRRPDESTKDYKTLSGVLFEILIKPILPFLDSTKTIYIVPDKSLSYLPFESLVSPATGRYLIEDYKIAYAPSSSVFVTCCQEGPTKGSPIKLHILSVGNPEFDRSAFPGLADLRSAKREAERIVEYYDSNVLLTGRDATESQVKSEIAKANVVHIAAHAVLDGYSPSRSKLLLSSGATNPDPESSDDGLLEAEEVYALRLPRTQLAVLSACNTGVDRYYNGEGMMSLARPFIAAGVPLVVASLWEVDSDSTADLMVDFHRFRREQKLPSVGALREAKLRMVSQGSERYQHPYYWAAFVAIGGYTYY